MLAALAGKSGRVIAMDIQEAALDAAALDAAALCEAADALAAALEAAADEAALLEADWEPPQPAKARQPAKAAVATNAIIFLFNMSFPFPDYSCWI